VATAYGTDGRLLNNAC